jgi:hypothetical protein
VLSEAGGRRRDALRSRSISITIFALGACNPALRGLCPEAGMLRLRKPSARPRPDAEGSAGWLEYKGGKYCGKEKSSRPTVPCDGPRMNRQVDVGNPPRPFRHLRMAERRTPDPSSSRAPVHSALVQKSVTAITNPAGRLSQQMLGETLRFRNRGGSNSWQTTCIQSNAQTRSGLVISR